MLDSGHQLILRAVADGDADVASPALNNLLASGLVEERGDGRYAITAAGRVALEDDEPTRWERLVWPVLTICGGVLVVDAIIGWVS